MGRVDEVGVGYPRDISSAAVVSFWAATVLASWVLLGLAVAGIWWLVT